MRILFSSTPAHGHLLPQLPLARAFRERGDEVAVLTAAGLAPVLAPEGIELLPAGPMPDVLLAEVANRTGVDVAGDPTPEGVAEFFAGVRIDLGGDEALAAAKGWAPDLIVSEVCDYIGPLVAADLDVPLATLAYGPALPPEFADGLAATAASRYASRGLTPRPASWYLDTCPDGMQWDNWQAPEGRLPMRSEPHRGAPTTPANTGNGEAGEAGGAGKAGAAARTGVPQVLVTFGTVFSAPEVLNPVLRELAAAGYDLRVTLGLTASASDFDVDSEHVTFLGFTPLDELLRDIDLVVAHGGAGTTFGTLAAGIPMVIAPQGADQFMQADRVSAAGAGLALVSGTPTPEGVAKSAAAVLADPSFAAGARVIAAQIAAMPAPAEVAEQLATALAAS
ncbi:glycosyltransferase [Streptomyces sp. 150FB]|uniref:glycosyltransferase n=1 Tax=Streptomyces sp. 150FB TaxID=1576605 RepID=UPI0005892F55|nr:glycosyltransferase [Streptomyces sp. 150FB]KIF76791.1 glycosyltransferase [Streptomyces sp. 150FB]